MKKHSIAKATRDVKREDKAVRKVLVEGKLLSKHAAKIAAQTSDSFVNFAQSLGVGARNPLTTATYGFNPITRVPIVLEFAHRGNWLAGVAVDLRADDMTRSGVEIEGEMDPQDMAEIEALVQSLDVWGALNRTVKWAHLYGGAVGYIMTDQDPKTPLRIEAIGKGGFHGVLTLDRWMVEPSLNDLVTEMGPNLGKPKFYTINTSAPALPGVKFHHSRCVRMLGIELPHRQAMQENLWGISVLERLYDRMIAFDSATTGAAQLVYKAYLRTYKVKGLRELIAAGGRAYEALVEQLEFMRQYQNTEGVTLMDSEDDFEGQGHNAFAGLSDALVQFGQQFAGGIQIPLVRLFGQSPSGFNTGDADLRMYYDSILQKQKKEMHAGVLKVYKCAAMSAGKDIPPDFGVAFRPLWQLTDKEKAEVAETTGRAVQAAVEAGLMSEQAGAKDLKQSSRETGIFSNIDDAFINSLSDEQKVPTPEELGLGLPGSVPGGEGLDSPDAEGPGKKAAKDTALETAMSMKRIHDLDVAIENPRGSIRRGIGDDKQPFESQLPDDYGYIRRTVGDDGDQVDCFVGSAHDSALVWIIQTLNPLTKKPDEQKVMLGYNTLKAAVTAFLGSYGTGGWDRIGGIVPTTVEGLKQWLVKKA